VRKLYLYPRFHSKIRDELEVPNAIHVTELQPTLTKRQVEIQSALAVLVMQCLRQLKQQTGHLVSWATMGHDGLSVENCVVPEHFDRAVSRQLEPHWHRLSPTVKQLVQDLRTLRTLFHALIQYDCVAFWKLLASLRTMSAASRHASLWLLEAATDTLYAKAKERVYMIQRPTPTAQIPNPVAKLVTVLEENPKWRLLKNTLNEIRQEHAAQREPTDSVTNILIMVQDDKTLDTIKSYLTQESENGTNKTLLSRWLRFLEHGNDRSRSLTEQHGGTASISEESRLLLEAEGQARRILFGDAKDRRYEKGPSAMSSLNHVPAHVRKRRKIATEMGRGTQTTDDLERQAVLEEAVEATAHDLDTSDDDSKPLASSLAETRKVGATSAIDPNTADLEDELFRVSFPKDELRVVLHSYASIQGEQGHLLLQDIRPRHVILFDCDMAFIRAVEIYAALSAQSAAAANQIVQPIRVVLIMFEASAEEKNFKKALEREQNAFERLIHHKKTMPPPALRSLETQEMQEALNRGGGVAGTYMGGTLPLSIDTRRGKRTTNASKDRRDIAVDVREFRSVLPSILHQGGMRLAPVTLTVGDFVLSNVHCVERKSISDLFGSFASGRLYSQAEAMSKYYKCPCLLIEFDIDKAFCLQNSNELGPEIRNDSVCSKMALLTMHFPKLRILWSRSPHETLKIFRELKTNHEEVDVDRAVEIGRSESEELLLHPDDGDEDEINETARAMLLRLPGVNVHSARRIMQECDSLGELCEMSRDDLRRIAGPVTGQKLYTFFNQKMGAT
jgi:DNA excision repair protein ERCC-4